ncbi:MAG: SCO1664 family protein [Aquihabitans sp.]
MPAPDSTEPATADAARVEELLRTADLTVCGQMPWSSNATLLCELWPAGSDAPGRRDDQTPLGRAIYKPHRGEQPLWDFPDGLYRREIAAYDLAGSIGWDVVPPTVERDGPYGVGSLQWFVDADFDRHYFTLLEDEATHEQLKRMCAFDFVANSTDRKGGHVLVDENDHLWGIDNGLCLHAEFKLRTVIWDFAGERLAAALADDLARFVERPLPPALVAVLNPFERDAVKVRARALLADGRLPTDPTGRRYPWPLV